MICADFLAGANLDNNGDPDVLLRALTSSFRFLSHDQRQSFLTSGRFSESHYRKQPPIRLERENYRQLREQILNRDRWRCQFCGRMSNLEVHH